MYWNGNKPQLSVLLTLIIALQKKGMSFSVFIDAATRHSLEDSKDVDLLDEILSHESGMFTEVTGGVPADRFILFKAKKRKTTRIITNDRFRDHSEAFPFVNEDGRLLKGAVSEGAIMLPDLDLDYPLRKSCRRSWTDIKTKLKK